MFFAGSLQFRPLNPMCYTGAQVSRLHVLGELGSSPQCTHSTEAHTRSRAVRVYGPEISGNTVLKFGVSAVESTTHVREKV